MNKLQESSIRITKSESLDLLYQLSLITEITDMNQELIDVFNYIINKTKDKDTGIRAQVSLEYGIKIYSLIGGNDYKDIYIYAEKVFNWVNEKCKDYGTCITAGSAVNRTINFGLSNLLSFKKIDDIFEKAESFYNWMIKI